MLVIRFARTGKKKQAYFRIVVAESKRAVGAKFVEILGNYNPHDKNLTVDSERLAFYLKNGAQPSNSVAKLLAKEKIELPKWVKVTEKKRAPKKEPEVKPEASKVEPEAPEAEEAPEEQPSTETQEAVPAEEAPAEEAAAPTEEPEKVEEETKEDNNEDSKDAES